MSIVQGIGTLKSLVTYVEIVHGYLQNKFMNFFYVIQQQIKSAMNKQQRPDLLTALCILTFIGSTTAFLGYFVASFFFEKTSELIIKYSSWHSTENISPLYFTILMALFAISLTGAIRIWKQHRDGFFLYLFSQLIILFLPAIWINWQAFSTTNTIFTVVFVVGYGLNWRWLKG